MPGHGSNSCCVVLKRERANKGAPIYHTNHPLTGVAGNPSILSHWGSLDALGCLDHLLIWVPPGRVRCAALHRILQSIVATMQHRHWHWIATQPLPSYLLPLMPLDWPISSGGHHHPRGRRAASSATCYQFCRILHNGDHSQALSSALGMTLSSRRKDLCGRGDNCWQQLAPSQRPIQAAVFVSVQHPQQHMQAWMQPWYRQWDGRRAPSISYIFTFPETL